MPIKPVLKSGEYTLQRKSAEYCGCGELDHGSYLPLPHGPVRDNFNALNAVGQMVIVAQNSAASDTVRRTSIPRDELPRFRCSISIIHCILKVAAVGNPLMLVCIPVLARFYHKRKADLLDMMVRVICPQHRLFRPEVRVHQVYGSFIHRPGLQVPIMNVKPSQLNLTAYFLYRIAPVCL